MKHFGKGRNLRILIAKEKDEIIGVAPFMVSKYSFLRLGKLRKLEFIGSPLSDYNNFILLKREKECLKLFLNHVMKHSDWDLLELRDMREGSVSARVMQLACSTQTSRLNLAAGTVCPYINLPDSLDVFSGKLSPNMRRNLRKRMRKLRAQYEVEVKTQRDFSSVREAMETFFKLHQKRWRSKGKLGAFASEIFFDFHLDLAEVFDEQKWLALRFLTVNDRPVASTYSFDYNLKKYGYLTGFDPDFGNYGVGNLLRMHIVEECIQNGLREYDLTRDFEPYKAEWATGIRKNYVVRMAHRGWFARLYDWSVRSDFSKLLIYKLGRHLTLETVDSPNKLNLK